MALLTRAYALGAPAAGEPEAEARATAAGGFLARGDRAGQTGRYDDALAAYHRAVELGARLDQTPEQRAATLTAEFHRDRGRRFARQGDAPGAQSDYDRTRALDPAVMIEYFDWAALCIAALTTSEIEIALSACTAATQAAGEETNYHDLLALAQALTGQTEVAEASFEAFLAFEAQPMRFRGDARLPPAYVRQVKAWRDAGRAGRLAADERSLADGLEGRVLNF